MFSHLGDLFNVPDRLQPVAIYQHRFQYTISTKRLRSPLTLRPLLLSVSPGRKRPTHLCSISLRVAIPACCWLAVLARAMAGLAARESIVMRVNGWIREKEKRVVAIRGRGESPQREKGVSGLRGRRIMPPPLSPTNTDVYFHHPLIHSRTCFFVSPCILWNRYSRNRYLRNPWILHQAKRRNA